MKYFFIGSGLGCLCAIAIYYIFLQNVISENTVALVCLGFVCTFIGGVVGAGYDELPRG